MGTRAGLEYPEGDPDRLAATADGLWSLATVVADAASNIARARSVAGWRGKSATMFVTAAERLSRPLADGADALHRAGRAVAELAAQVKQAQRWIRGWAEEIEEAERRAHLAMLTAGSPTRIPADRMLQYYGLPPEAHQHGLNLAEERLVDELRARHAPKARQLCEQIEDSDRRASEIVVAAADAAPAGGARVPGAPDVPIDVRIFAPVWMFAPEESYLPADPRFQDVDDPPADHLRGQGAGAPIFYRVRRFGDETIIEYWFYRRHNDYRDVDRTLRFFHRLPNFGHPDDSEAVAVRIRDGRPVQVGYTQHTGGCSLPFADAPKEGGHLVSYPGDGSGSNSPFPGHDRILGLFGGPIGELHGPAPDEQTPPDHTVHAGDNLHSYRDGRDWRLFDPEGNLVPDNDHNSGKFEPGSSVWEEQCETLPKRR